MISRAQRFATIASLMTVVGCQMTPTRYENQDQGQWQVKALVRDKKASKSFIVNLDVNAIQKDKLRLDITAAMGHPVASLVMDGERLTYVLIENREFYTGAANANAMRPVLAIPLDPHVFYSLLFEAPLNAKNWVCSRDKKDFLAECKEASSGTSIRWTERKGNRKTIYVEHPQATLQLNFMNFKPKVEARSALFELNAPKSFKPIRL